jgi:hypothetical protein
MVVVVAVIELMVLEQLMQMVVPLNMEEVEEVVRQTQVLLV